MPGGVARLVTRPFGTSGTPLRQEGCRTVQRSLVNLLLVPNFKPLQLHHNMAKSYKEAEARITEGVDSISDCKNAIAIPKLYREFDVPVQ